METALTRGLIFELAPTISCYLIISQGNSKLTYAMSEVLLLGKIFMVMPATNAVSERSFSALKRIKSYLRSTTSNNRLMVLHVHKYKLDKLNFSKLLMILLPISTVVDEFLECLQQMIRRDHGHNELLS